MLGRSQSGHAMPSAPALLAQSDRRVDRTLRSGSPGPGTRVHPEKRQENQVFDTASPSLGRVEIVAASVGVELAEQPVLVDHLGQREAQSPGSHAKRQASSAFARAGSGAASCHH
jgi:hypothetical protein